MKKNMKYIPFVLVGLSVFGFGLYLYTNFVETRFKPKDSEVTEIKEVPELPTKYEDSTKTTATKSVPSELKIVEELLTIKSDEFSEWYEYAKIVMSDKLQNSLGVSDFYNSYKDVMYNHDTSAIYSANSSKSPFSSSAKITDYTRNSPTTFVVSVLLTVRVGSEVHESTQTFNLTVEEGKITLIDGWFADVIKREKKTSKEEYLANNSLGDSRIEPNNGVSEGITNHITSAIDEARTSYNGFLTSAFVDKWFTGSDFMTVMRFYTSIYGNAQEPRNNNLDFSSLVVNGSDSGSFEFLVMSEDGSYVVATVKGSYTTERILINTVDILTR